MPDKIIVELMKPYLDEAALRHADLRGANLLFADLTDAKG